jgi:hypothetical protein
MSSDDDLQEWLQAQPLDTPVEINGESVYLKVEANGAELGAFLLHGHAQSQLREALLQGFSSAIDFDAGLGQSADGNSLTLTQWLPGVFSWRQAADSLERLLNQLSVWRAALEPAARMPVANTRTRTENRLRKNFAGARA